MKKSILFVIVFVFLTVLTNGCAPASAPAPTSVPATPRPSLVPPTSTPEPTATVTVIPSSWEVYTNESWGFSLERPTAWTVLDNNTESGFFGKQVFWWVGNYDPMKQRGDVPAVDQTAQVDINGQPATRVLGHYQGAMGDMGYQQYLKYVVQRGEFFYTFTLYAVNALGIPQEMMTEILPLRESDTALFEQMMATMKFKD
jgi:hypothetical protein